MMKKIVIVLILAPFLFISCKENVANKIKKENLEIAKGLFDIAGEYWRQAIKLAPNNYIEAQNWLKTTGRMASDNMY